MTITHIPSDESLIKRITCALNSQSQPTKTVLSSLLAVQDSIGYISDKAMEAIADFCDVTINDVWSVACFYTNFRFSPPGEHILDVCWGPSCHIMGAQLILNNIRNTLNITDEGETPDGKVTLRYSTCLGACAHAPVIAIDHSLKGRFTPEIAAPEVKRLLEKRDEDSY